MKKARLEDLVRDATGYTLTATIRVAVEKIAEEIAKEILQDPTFRASLKSLVERSAQEALAGLTERGR